MPICYISETPSKKINISGGERYVTTVPVKLARAQNKCKKHIDKDFLRLQLTNTSRNCVHYSDHILYRSYPLMIKQRSPLGIAAATKQAPILMHLEYQVKLPDHTFSVGNKHKSIPSVIGLCTITPHKFRQALNYSGPTYIGIRSMKHDTSNALTHAKDHMLNKDGKV